MRTVAKAPAVEKRAYQRVPIALAGKLFLPQKNVEQDCSVTNISLGGATLACEGQPDVGTDAVLTLPGFDQFSGVIIHSGPEKAGMRFDGSEAKRESIASRIMLHLLTVAAAGAQPSFAPKQFKRPCGEVAEFEVRELSLGGAVLKTAARPPLGEVVMVGATPGRVTRHHDDGIALEFVRQG